MGYMISIYTLDLRALKGSYDLYLYMRPRDLWRGDDHYLDMRFEIYVVEKD